MTEYRDGTVALADAMRQDLVARERFDVAAPAGDVRVPPPNRLLVEHAQLVVVRHQLGESVDITAIDAVDEVDDRRHGRDTFRHRRERMAIGPPLASVPDGGQARDGVCLARPEARGGSSGIARPRCRVRHARRGADRSGRCARRRRRAVAAFQLSVPQLGEESARPTEGARRRDARSRHRTRPPRQARAGSPRPRRAFDGWSVLLARRGRGRRPRARARDCSCSAIRCTRPGSPTSRGSEHFGRLRVPVLFASGTRDALAGKVDLTKAARRIKGTVSFHWIDTADHGYRPLKSSGRTSSDVLSEVATVSADWVRVLPR